MSSRPSNTIAEQLNAAQLAINNSLGEPEIQSLVAAYGYSTARLNQGKALHQTALEAVNAHKALAGAQQDTTQALEAAQKAAYDAYQALAKVARAVFVGDKAQLAALGLNGPMPRTTAGFLAAAYTLFNNAAGITALADYGYNAARLNSERTVIAAYDTANQAQEAAKGTAQQASREQSAALKALKDWTAQYRKIARVALRGKPQLLEKIGVVARTSPTKAQREARRRKTAM